MTSCVGWRAPGTKGFLVARCARLCDCPCHSEGGAGHSRPRINAFRPRLVRIADHHIRRLDHRANFLSRTIGRTCELAMPLEPGALLLNGRYRIVRLHKLGSPGTAGAVYRALDTIRGVEVAVKENPVTHPGFQLPFMLEARFLAS